MLTRKEAKFIAKKINEYKNIVIVKHQLPDWDAQGSAIGLAHLINDNWKNKNIFVAGDRLHDEQQFAKPLNQQALSEALIITVDTAVASRLDFNEWKQGKESIKIDHHIAVEDYATYNFVDVNAIAAAQVVTMWAVIMKLKISPIAAENLYKGISTDSGRFLFQATNAETMEAAKQLLLAGADLTKINNYLYVTNLKQRQWNNFAFSKMQLTKNGVAYIIIEEKDYKDWNISYYDIKAALGTMAGLDEIKIWFTVIEWEKEYKVSMRSREYDVNSVAVKYNGGGHKVASGAKLTNLDQLKGFLRETEKLVKNIKG
ncbi:DHH family phosphoesterase [Williamsoniiplasma lucivorax]|uniref:DHH family protein n=1 Tax=Williamsoniiplasma lucivorax TaxID=209274 RepID=A0A2S5RFN7_9MOLU|nr:bifunctional oligoribonuclease/PAP phosphatase NrnA [Williamsoniiplasma lucivorax]PPE06032.1 DHH family protein [Williamsoniiplasma lucivorax]